MADSLAHNYPVTSLTPLELRLFPVDALLRLSVAANWNQTAADWQRILALSPGLCWGLVVDGQLAATATAIVYDSQVAWIGMVLTLPEFRGRGLARHLVAHLLELLQRQGIPSIKLDATAMGATLYREFGFVEERAIERWSRPGTIPNPIGKISYDAALDQEATGLSRLQLLDALARDSAVWATEDGSFAMLRPGAHASYLGPIIARNERSATQLLSSLSAEAAAYWDLFPEHLEAKTLATQLGFEPIRQLLRMSLGNNTQATKLQLQYGIAGFEYG